MTKFWAVVTVIFASSLALLFMTQSNPVNFTDLETECQYDRGTVSNMDLRHNRLYFSGHFPVENPNADLTYGFNRDGESIKLNIKKSNDKVLTDFYNTCKGVAVYDGVVREKLDSGRYTITVEHAGEEADKRIIRVN